MTLIDSGCVMYVRVGVHPPGVHQAAGAVSRAPGRLLAQGRGPQGRDTARWALSRNRTEYNLENLIILLII